MPPPMPVQIVGNLYSRFAMPAIQKYNLPRLKKALQPQIWVLPTRRTRGRPTIKMYFWIFGPANNRQPVPAAKIQTKTQLTKKPHIHFLLLLAITAPEKSVFSIFAADKNFDRTNVVSSIVSMADKASATKDIPAFQLVCTMSGNLQNHTLAAAGYLIPAAYNDSS